MAFRVVRPDELEWLTRPSEPGEAQRHTAQLNELAGFRHHRANLWRYEPGAKGRRHRHPQQDETFVVVAGTLTMYLGEPPERQEVGRHGLIHVEAGTPLQIRNEGDEELLLYIHGWPPEHENAEILDSVV
jgi:mannose-6-phosphate isomerase-like protein (cupin superfamily)